MPKHLKISRRAIIQAGVATTAAMAIAPRAEAQISGVGVAEGTLPGRSAQFTLEGNASTVTPRQRLGIDIHAHYYPQAYLDVIGTDGKPFGGEYRQTADGYFLKGGGFSGGPFPAKFTDLKLRLADMDAQGVEMHALSLTRPMPYFGSPDFALKLARAFNDAANAAHLQYPNRFVGLMALPMTDRDRAMDELERAAKLPGVRGVYLGCNVEGRDFSDPEFLPVFKRIEALNLPVFLHPNGAIGGKRFEPFYLANILGNPFDTTIAACHLIYGGVLDACPKLQITLPHAGGAIPMLIGRMDQGYAVRRDVPALPQPPSAYMRRFTYDMIGHKASVVKFLISEVGAERVMLGSDYCLDMGYLRPVQDLDELNLNPRERNLILHGTAAKLLKI
ncbi:MAG TPA: amidohydrolase family protein [Micropepsaceae bacterium]|nr:amidohydrolase family protein [Micropepsaceae bacterium]